MSTAAFQPPTPPCEAILLAAGQSRRMQGMDKRLLPVAGLTMVRRSASLYLELGMPLTVVIAADDAPVADALAGLDLRLIVNPAAASGQDSSVHAGLAEAALAAPGLLVALADQPLLTVADVRNLAEFFAGHDAARICVPRFAGQRGNPVLFPAAVARRLRITGETPRAFIDAHPELVAWFDAANAHFTRDIDTREDAAELLGVPIAGPLSG